MKKPVLTLLTVCLFFGYSQATTVKEKDARIVAANYLASTPAFSQHGKTALLKICYAPEGTATTKSNASPAPLYYVYNINGSEGFIIISGDDAVHPVLASSSEGAFIADNMPANLAGWLEDYGNQISFAITAGLDATPQIRSEWASLSKSNPSAQIPGSQQGVSPLMTTTWDQGPYYYNTLCPRNFFTGEWTVTGCVATAMAMVMKYHNWPPSGINHHEYLTPLYGKQGANFSGTTYNWKSMPNKLEGQNGAVAKLMYHCGVSVEMNYNISSAGGSTAEIITARSWPRIHCTEYALKTYFGYESTLQGVQKDNYSDIEWASMLKTELDAKRPIIYGGLDGDGGHCFVLDGYSTNIMGDFFHINWGWGGKSDGDFRIDNLNPGTGGIGGGTGAYNSKQHAILGVKPGNTKSSGNKYYKLYMSAPITFKSETINYKDTISFHTNIINNDPVVFNGDISAAVFDTNDIFIDYVQVFKGVTLQPGAEFPSGITFTNQRISAMLPGSYYVGINYSTGDSNWKDVIDTNSYLSEKRIKIVNQNDIEMYSNMNIGGGVIITKGNPLSIQLEIKNNGPAELHGTLALSLFDVDGDSVNVIEEKTGFTLPSQEHTNGLTFNTPSLNVNTGTYLLALQYLPEGATEWELVGSSVYRNPVKIWVLAVPLIADQYESNNTQETATALTVSFETNPAVIMTNGANCHNGLDYDFYKIALPEGYTYVLSGILYDERSDPSHGYTLDGIWSYSTDGKNWSAVFDDTIPHNIVMNNGGTVLFHLSPEYTGETGTYQIKIGVARNPLGIGETDSPDGITIYPNPASERLIIYSLDRQAYISGYQMNNIEGREIMNIKLPEPVPECTINTAQLNDGFYFLRIITASGVINRKVIIRK
ncbi:MAG: thiol protease/hemagglutinin PrtT [Bacteroidota bacterium]